MTEPSETSPEENSAAEIREPLCGERLAEARREQQITVLEVAKELHLDEPKVRALERNDFELLGAPVFAKGHLRKYAQLVGVDEDDVFTDYYTMTRAEAMPPIIPRRKMIRQGISPGPWIAVIAVVIVAAAAYWWLAMREAPAPVAPSPSEQTPALPAEDEILQPQPQPLQDEQVLLDEFEQEQGAEAQLEAEQEAVVAAPASNAPAAAPDQLRLAVNFSGECWTEISDADGQRLFYSMGRDGQSVELSGKAPISALFGNADNVEVTVNGSAYSLPVPDSSNRTVRVAILNQ
jgi:cytoskeleton protein RodZ